MESLWIHTAPFPPWKFKGRTSLVVQWLRICLPMQGTRVQSLVQEDPTCHRTTKPVCHNYWACMPQLLKPVLLEPMLHNKRNHHNEKPTHRSEESPPLATTRESPQAATKTPHSQKKRKINSRGDGKKRPGSNRCLTPYTVHLFVNIDSIVGIGSPVRISDILSWVTSRIHLCVYAYF